LYFVEAKKDKYKEIYPDLKHKELVNKLWEDWGKLPDDEKKPFEDLGEADKQRYHKEKEEYLSSKSTLSKKVKLSDDSEENSSEI